MHLRIFSVCQQLLNSCLEMLCNLIHFKQAFKARVSCFPAFTVLPSSAIQGDLFEQCHLGVSFVSIILLAFCLC